MKKQENKSTRNDGRMTHVAGIIANMQEQTFTPFECDVPYARSNDKLAKSVREVMNLDDACMVSISEIQQTETERKFYSDSALYMCADAESFIDEDEAKAYARDNGLKVVAGNIYNYATQVFAIDNRGDYHTNHFDWTCGDNWTAIDARAALAMRYEEFTGQHVIAIHSTESPRGFVKSQDVVYYAISAEDLSKCERVVKHRK